MPDITMCKGESGSIVCKERDQCYRYTAEPSPYLQSYFVEIPIIAGDACDHFWNNGELDE